jgi:hypothetical protein
VHEEYLDRVRGYHTTEAYKKAYRKRSVWVEPLFARSASSGMACDAFACGSSGASIVRHLCEQEDKISNAYSRSEDGDGVRSQ